MTLYVCVDDKLGMALWAAGGAVCAVKQVAICIHFMIGADGSEGEAQNTKPPPKAGVIYLRFSLL